MRPIETPASPVDGGGRTSPRRELRHSPPPPDEKPLLRYELHARNEIHFSASFSEASGYGGRVWAASLLLAKHLLNNSNIVEGQRVLELGAEAAY